MKAKLADTEGSFPNIVIRRRHHVEIKGNPGSIYVCDTVYAQLILT